MIETGPLGRIVDLTFPLQEEMQTFPVHWHPTVEIKQLGRIDVEGRETRKLTLGTHTGTHMDAPKHFIPGGCSIEQIPLGQLVGPATVIDFSALPPRTEISASDVEKALDGAPVERLVLRYDWSDHYGTDAYYRDHPYLSQQAALWLVKKGCRLLAMDSPMPDDPRNGSKSANDSPNHKIFLGQGAVLVEYLTNLKALTQRQVTLVVAPLKIVGGDGSPVRCFAIENSK